MSKDPIFVTGVSIARSQDFVVAALFAPTGEFKSGKLEAGEVVRVVMSVSTLRAMTNTMLATCREIDEANAVAAAARKSGEAPDLDEDAAALGRIVIPVAALKH